MKTIAFITRVHPKRAKMLKVCINSIKAQTDDDYTHIIYRNDKTKDGYGVIWANETLKYVDPIDARYVMVLDDDDMLIEPDFVKIFKKAINGRDPEIVFFKGIIHGKRVRDRGIRPRSVTWGKRPSRGGIASFCFAIRLDVWKKHVHRFNRRGRSGGDYYFISYCYSDTKDHIWLDHVIAETQMRAGRGKGEHEHA